MARAAESRGCLEPGDWPDVAVSLLMEDNDDPEIVELAGLSRRAGGWDTNPLVAAAYDRHGISVPAQDAAVDLVARVLADDFRARPAAVTGPMIRLLARLAPRTSSRTWPVDASPRRSTWTADAATTTTLVSRPSCNRCRRWGYQDPSCRHSRGHYVRLSPWFSIIVTDHTQGPSPTTGTQ